VKLTYNTDNSAKPRTATDKDGIKQTQRYGWFVIKEARKSFDRPRRTLNYY